MRRPNGFLWAATVASIVFGAAMPAAAGPSLLLDANTGAVLDSEQAFQRWYPASLTKLMTAYVAFRAIQLGEVTLESPVRISERATKEPPSKMGYPAGTVLTLDAARKKDSGVRSDLDAGIAKLYATEIAQECVLDAMRIHGGVGYSKELPLERYYRDAPLMVIAEGTSDIQKTVIARGIVKDYPI